MEDLVEQPVDTSDSNAAGNTAAEDDNEAESQFNDDSDSASQEQAEEDEEIDIGDQKVALPKSLAEKVKTGFMQQADYTQKTQGIAAERQQIVAEREQIRAQAKEQQEYLSEMAGMRAIDMELKKIEDMHIENYTQSDPTGVVHWQEQRRLLESKKAEIASSLTQKQEKFALDKQQSFAKQVQQAEAYIEREIKGANPERLKALETYATKEGMDVREFAKAIIKTPMVAKFMHKAELYDKLMAKQAPKPPPVAAAKPALKVGSTATVAKDPGKMTDKEFAVWRRSQIKNRK